jgi:hypothetical protein
MRTDRRARRFGLTQQQFNELKARHDGCCPICGSARDLVIDHCHATGRVRDMICRSCNTAVGHIERTGMVSYWGTERDQRHKDYIDRWALVDTPCQGVAR